MKNRRKKAPKPRTKPVDVFKLARERQEKRLEAGRAKAKEFLDREHGRRHD